MCAPIACVRPCSHATLLAAPPLSLRAPVFTCARACLRRLLTMRPYLCAPFGCVGAGRVHRAVAARQAHVPVVQAMCRRGRRRRAELLRGAQREVWRGAEGAGGVRGRGRRPAAGGLCYRVTSRAELEALSCAVGRALRVGVWLPCSWRTARSRVWRGVHDLTPTPGKKKQDCLYHLPGPF